MPSTTSTTSKKPIGPCAACNKEGAVLRCAPCREAGVDVFFCNRTCQIKLWKTHKAVCKRTCNAKSKKEQSSANKEAKAVCKKKARNAESRSKASTANKEAKAEGKEGLQLCKEATVCPNCFKSGDDIGSKLSACSKCNSAYYCSRECQVEDWPKHKRMCKNNCQASKRLETSLDSRGNNIKNLFLKWIAEPSSLSCYYDALYLALKKEDIEQQPPVKAVLVEVEFNYNAQTFIVAEVPRAVAIDDLSQKRKKEIRKILKERTVTGGKDQVYNHFAIVSTKEFEERFEGTVGIGIMKSALDQMNADRKSFDMEKLHNDCAHVRLKSNLFRGWKSIRRNNLQKQMEQMKLGQSCTAFVQNALQFFCKKSLQNTHQVIVYMNMGQEIGQISQLDEYEIISIAELKKFKEENKKKIITYVEDIESRPHSCNEMAIETLFVDDGKCFVFEYTVYCRVNVIKNKTAKQCKKAAEKHFRQLQKEVKEMPSDLLEKVSL
ncbi:hypothetical protein CTEN210_17831 [Chaetoceros tenuissimus]|uniref:MYND-type domain-containing protein n=1 Tax=Chaetoceros tenuissimus TaxID=426638 RepID=A0AAD3HF49_9STRA|nr:hypothetical protein CTEN210_17831 [Chaetoceros tenuissimus]